ncbi:unnamed protein product [Cunninghamella blakesleeana]
MSYFSELPDIKVADYKLISNTIFWRHLTRFPVSYTKIDDRWIEHMDKLSKSVNECDKTKITSVSIDINSERYYVVTKDEYSEMTLDDECDKNIFLIEDQVDCQLPKKYNDAKSNEEIIFFDSYYWKLPSSFTNLKKLYLRFETVSKNDDISYYSYNETTLDSISTSCPSLTHLTLRGFNFNISGKYQPGSVSPINFNNIKSSLQLQYFCLQFCFLHEPECYKYIQYKYPNLTTLNLELIYLPIMNEYHSEYRSAISDLITSYNTLTELGFNFTNYCTECYKEECIESHDIDDQRFWPHKEILVWLMTNPNSLKSLLYPFDLFTIEKEDYSDWSVMLAIERSIPDDQKKKILLQRRNYLNYLSTLYLNIQYPSVNTLNYLHYLKSDEQKASSSSSVYPNLKRLIIYSYQHLNHNTQESLSLFLYDWLHVLPDLNCMEIRDFMLQFRNEMIVPYLNEQQIILTPKKMLSYTYPYYQLTKLKITRCGINGEIGEITHLLRSLIYLKSLYIKNVWFTAGSAAHSFNIMAPHLQFSYLQLSQLKYNQIYMEEDQMKCGWFYIQNIKLIETASNTNTDINDIIQKEISVNPSDLWLTFTCCSVDYLWT